MRSRDVALGLTLAWLAAGGAAQLTSGGAVASRVWLAGVIVLGAPIIFRTVRGIARGHLAADIVASLSIVGAVALSQPLAGLVIVLMQTGGEALERYAEGKASAAVQALEAAAPRVAHRVGEQQVEDLPVSSVTVGDTLLVRPGELVPCDGTILEGESQLDTSSLTGEAAPRRATAGVAVMSGMINGEGSFRMRATAPAEQSQYARIVELVRSAQTSKSPLQRIADRYAVWFTPITVIVCGVAVWITKDWMRALAILVVATPCPLILATPVAIIGGINRAAKRFVIVRHGGALERLSEVNVAVFDKTGTLTIGKPRVHGVAAAPMFDADDVMRRAAAVEEHSSHLLARALVDSVRGAGLRPLAAEQTVETPGQGVSGRVDGRVVRVGARAYVLPECVDGVMRAADLERSGATLRAYVSIDDRLAAVVEYADEIREELPEVLADLERAGVRRVALLSGDNVAIARAVADQVGIRETHGDLLPEDKAKFVERLRAEGQVVLMVGDGVNDAPALSMADVGVALAGNAVGRGITTEAADVIVLVDSLERVPEAMSIARRTMRIARQSIWAGLGLSGVAMLVAAFGHLPPLAGAAIQEAIDVAVILNALRASASGDAFRPPPAPLPPPNRSERGHAPSLRRVSTVRA